MQTIYFLEHTCYMQLELLFALYQQDGCLAHDPRVLSTRNIPYDIVPARREARPGGLKRQKYITRVRGYILNIIQVNLKYYPKYGQRKSSPLDMDVSFTPTPIRIDTPQSNPIFTTKTAQSQW